MTKLIPGIFLADGKAVAGATNNDTVSEAPSLYAKDLADKGADMLFVFDLSEDDNEHEKNILVMQEICKTVSVPVAGGGRVKRLEDVKKYLYAGCEACLLDFEKEENIALAQEAAARFSRDKIWVTFNNPESFVKAPFTARENASCLVCTDSAYAFKSAEMCPDTELILTVNGNDPASLAKLIEIANVCGITGQSVTAAPEMLHGMKTALKELGIEVLLPEAKLSFADLKLNSDGLIPVIVQDYRSGEILMLAYMNEESFNLTIETGKMTYFSRSRQSLWVKGETSGHFQYVQSLRADCDFDTILAKVYQIGPACHTGSRSCFFNEIIEKEQKAASNPLEVFEEVYDVIRDRKIHPKEGSYTNYLFDKGIDKILKKLGEEAVEIVIAAKNPEPEEVKYEIADFLYHMMVLMCEKGLSWEEITDELSRR